MQECMTKKVLPKEQLPLTKCGQEQLPLIPAAISGSCSCQITQWFEGEAAVIRRPKSCHPITSAWPLYDQGNVWPRNAPAQPAEGEGVVIGWQPFDSCHPITTAWPLYDQGNVWHPVTAKILGVRPISSWRRLSGDLKVDTSLIRTAPAQPVGMYGQGTWQGGNALR